MVRLVFMSPNKGRLKLMYHLHKQNLLPLMTMFISLFSHKGLFHALKLNAMLVLLPTVLLSRLPSVTHVHNIL